MGLELRNPVVASAGPLTQTLDGFKALNDAGIGAIVMYSLFEEQIRAEEARQLELEEDMSDLSAEALSFFPSVPTRLPSDGDATSRAYLRLLEQAAQAVDVPVIASLNGSTIGGWTKFAQQMESAGAAGLELNIYYVPGQADLTGEQVEQRHIDILKSVKQEVSIPVAVKLAPYFSSFGDFARRLDTAGADGLVMFNRFFQPEIDVDRMEMVPGVELSEAFDARLPRTWIASLVGKVQASLAGTSGVQTATEVVKYLLSGADIAMTTSALVRYGTGYVKDLLDGLERWMTAHEMTEVSEMRGLLAVPADANVDVYEREGYVAALQKAKQTYGSLTGL
jgi:dihydroorotate dehydrogenase (fumarate)